MVMQLTADLQVGVSIPGRLAGGRRGFELPAYMSAVGCITTRPLLVLQQLFSPLLEAESTTEKQPNYVFCFCLPACLPD